MASKPSARKKSHAKPRKPVAKKARSRKKARVKTPGAEQRPVYVMYDQNSGSLVLWPNNVKVHKADTDIKWVTYPGSDPVTFELDPSAQSTPFGSPSPNGTHTQITLHYLGSGGDPDKDWTYEAQVTATGVVTLSSPRALTDRSTIKNH